MPQLGKVRENARNFCTMWTIKELAGAIFKFLFQYKQNVALHVVLTIEFINQTAGGMAMLSRMLQFSVGAYASFPGYFPGYFPGKMPRLLSQAGCLGYGENTELVLI